MNAEGERPSDIAAYRDWLRKEHAVDSSYLSETYFDMVVSKVHRDFGLCEFWQELIKKLPEFDQEYLTSRDYRLLLSGAVELHMKSYPSFFLKTFRKNALENKAWPSPPKGEWILPPAWFSQINDLVRTMVVVKYLDGVEFLAERIKGLAESHKLACTIDYEARETGYYAAHIYVTRNFEIPTLSWKTESVPFKTEIQITTQLQETILKLTHTLYEARRERTPVAETKWQWDYKSQEFVANYLGHILHYLEGMIMEVRDKQRER